ncbi:MAG: hypothetical protein ACI89X_004389 [Planctomycetota bacterium]|jgi:hypothetical protein
MALGGGELALLGRLFPRRAAIAERNVDHLAVQIHREFHIRDALLAPSWARHSATERRHVSYRAGV